MAFFINMNCFALAFAASIFTILYSAPPARLKRFHWFANITIAMPRGVLLKVAGWSVVKDIRGLEPWYIGLIFGGFLIGAMSTKDYSDIKGDKTCGCQTLPIRYGVRKSIFSISPFFVLPFLFMSIGALSDILTGNKILLIVLGIILASWGGYLIWLLLRTPDAVLERGENHPAWYHMYGIIMCTQVGFAVAYML
jgi:4-hydroxybenzoate polyprenyltransferase